MFFCFSSVLQYAANPPKCSDANVRRILMLQLGQSAPTFKNASRAAAVREGPRTKPRASGGEARGGREAQTATHAKRQHEHYKDRQSYSDPWSRVPAPVGARRVSPKTHYIAGQPPTVRTEHNKLHGLASSDWNPPNAQPKG